MCYAGMNVARLNFSHGTHPEHLEKINLIKKVREKLELPIAIMLDTKGPEIRLKDFKDGSVILESGDEFTLTSDDVLGDKKIASVTYENLPYEVETGCKILIDDGKVELLVLETNGSNIKCQVVNGGKIGNSICEDDQMDVAKAIQSFFPDTDLELLAEVIQNYKDIDAWNDSPILKEESFNLLQDVMSAAGELENRVPYGDVVNNSFAEEAVGK